MRLNAVIAAPEGPETRPPLLVAHGLFGSARNWGGLSKRFAAGGRRVIAVDMRHHGDSPRAPAGGYGAMADDLAETLAAEAGGPADVLGHSMGGKAAMTLALMAPGTVRRLVVADIAPVTYAHTHLPVIEALRGMDLAGVARRSHADARLAEAVPDRALRAFLLQSLSVGPEGARWKLDLEALAAEMPDLLAFPALSGRFEGPALFLAGAASDYVTAEGREAARALFPAATFETLPDAGHWLHAERPEAFAEAVAAFLDA